MEARLRLLEAVMASVNDVVIITEPEPLDEPGPRIQYVNPAFTRTTGYLPEEAIGRSPRMLQGQETDRDATARIRAGLERREPVREELLNYRKDGSPFWVEISIVPIVNGRGRLTHWASVQRETTQRREAQDAAIDLAREEAARAEAERCHEAREAVIRASPLAVTALDPAGRVEMWNPAAERIFGWTEAEAVGRQMPVVPEEMEDEHRRIREAAMRGETITGLATYRRRKDGSRVDVELSTAALRDEQGQVRGTMVLHEDITERKRAEQQERRLTAILEGTPDLVATADPEGRVLYLNGAGRRMLGIGPDEDPAQLDVATVYPEWALGRILRDAIPTAIRERSWSGETAFLHRDGSEIAVSQVILSHDGPNGEVSFLSTIARDIRERRRREEELQFLAEASQAFGSTLEHETTLQGLARLAASRLADLCIVDVRDDSGLRRVAQAHRDSAEGTLQSLEHYAPDARRPVGMEAAIRTGQSELVPDVSAAWLRAAASNEEHFQALRRFGPRSAMIVPLVARGRTFGAVGLFSVVRGRYGPDDLALAQELVRRAALAVDNARLYEKSQQATRVRDEVLRVVAHDLRNPLNAISVSTGFLEETVPVVQSVEREQLAIIQRSVERANRLIQDLLDVARMEARQLTVEKRREETASLLRETVELHRALAADKRIQLRTQIPGTLPAIEVDRDRILQIFSNLIGNALKFTPTGGTITVRAEPAEGEVRFSISDTGPGIPEAQLPHLFDPFWQASQGAREGAGLGLAISRGLAEAHGGRIWVESDVGEGTTFHVVLPAPGVGER